MHTEIELQHLSLWLQSTVITLSTAGVGKTEKERVCVYVLRQKGVLLPQDVAFKAEEVGFLWRKRSQNRRLLG